MDLPRPCTGERSLLSKWSREYRDPMQKWGAGPSPCTVYKINSKWIEGLHLRPNSKNPERI